MDKINPHLQEQLDFLAERILRLGGLVEEAIGKSVQALADRNEDLAREVLDGDATIDRLELEIDELCLELLARNQPMARDLRFITTAMKITPDLERMADHAVNVSERVLELIREPPLNAQVEIPRMARLAQAMVRGALDAFIRGDADVARATIAMDEEVDRLMEQVFRLLLSHMLEDQKTITRSLRLTFVAKYFERIADQATNICEMVVFMSEARVIKHSRPDAGQRRD